MRLMFEYVYILITMAMKVKINIKIEKKPIYFNCLIIKTGSRTISSIAE